MPADCKSLNNTSVGSGLSPQTCSILSKYSGSLGSNVSNLLNKRNESSSSEAERHSTSHVGVDVMTQFGDIVTLGDVTAPADVIPLKSDALCTTHDFPTRDKNGNEDSGVSTIGSGCSPSPSTAAAGTSGGSTTDTAGNTAAGDVLRRKNGDQGNRRCSESGQQNRLSVVSNQSKNGNTAASSASSSSSGPTGSRTSTASTSSSKRFSGMSIDSHHSNQSSVPDNQVIGNCDVIHAGVHVTAKRGSIHGESHPATVTSKPIFRRESPTSGAGDSPPPPVTSSSSSSGRSSPVLTSDGDNDDLDNLSKGCLSLEFDDYPLDLVSPIKPEEEDDLKNDKIPFRPNRFRNIGGLQKQATSTPKYNGDRLSFMEYNEILYDAGTDDQRGFMVKRTSTPKYPQSKQDRLSGYMYDALREYPPKGLFQDRLVIKDRRAGDLSASGWLAGLGGLSNIRTFFGYVCRPLMRRHNPTPPPSPTEPSPPHMPPNTDSENDEDTPTHKKSPPKSKRKQCGRLYRALLCPPRGNLSTALTFTLAWVGTLGVLWGVTPDAQALPGGNIFALMVVFAACSLAGVGARGIGLPSILGMLVTGCLLRNIPAINIGKDIDVHWAAAIRTAALVVVLVRTGYGLEPQVLRSLSAVILRLAFIPLVVETVAVTVAAHFLLQLPVVWSFMLGFVLSAVTPAVVVPAMLHLKERQIGTNHDIPSLVIAASGVDHILAITGFTVCLGIAFSDGHIALNILRGPLEALAGAAYGALLGVIISYVPHKRHKHVVLWRMLLLQVAALFAVVFGVRMGAPGGGGVACVLLGFITGLKWKKQGTWKTEQDPIAKNLGRIWVLLEPMLFGLIGCEADIHMVEGHVIGMAVAVILIGTGFRMVASFLAVFRSHLSIKERLFIPFAWLPKATVQAAIGSVALDAARVTGVSEQLVANGTVIVAAAVLSILIMAPVGAATIGVAATCCLKKARDGAISSVENSEIEAGQISPNAEELTWDDHLDFDTEFTKMRLDFDRSKPLEITTEMETVT